MTHFNDRLIKLDDKNWVSDFLQRIHLRRQMSRMLLTVQ